MSVSKYTYEEMEIARFTDIPNLAETFGHEVQARGHWHFLKDAQHIVIKNRTRYFDNYKQEWGDAITFLEDYADMSFREAMDFLLNYNGYARDTPAQKPEIKLPKKEEKQPIPFALPEPNEDNRRVFSYLRKRGIAWQVIDAFIKSGLRFKEFYALRDIDLTIRQGESWALVGRNGAGKSTLLKLICKIISPYKGKVWTRGSIAPMIELGAGFDVNLTAKENIYINGAILGHSQKYMKEYYDEIKFNRMKERIDFND